MISLEVVMQSGIEFVIFFGDEGSHPDYGRAGWDPETRKFYGNETLSCVADNGPINQDGIMGDRLQTMLPWSLEI